MLDDTFGWSHARGDEVVPSPWQATHIPATLDFGGEWGNGSIVAVQMG